MSADAWGVRAVREAIEAVDPGSSVEGDPGEHCRCHGGRGIVRVPLVAPRLLAYARALQFEGRWELAADVHRTVIAHAHPVEEADIVIAANMQLGRACVRSAQWDEASVAYTRARVRGSNDRRHRQRAASPHLRGKRRERSRESAVSAGASRRDHSRVRRQSSAEVRALALHARADVALRRGEFEAVIGMAYEALDGLTAPSARDRVLARYRRGVL